MSNPKSLAASVIEPAADLLKSLANPQRLMIVCALMKSERAVSDLERELAIRQPSLSQHLASLREAGLITPRREAKAVFYRLSDGRAAMLVQALQTIFDQPKGRRLPIALSERGRPASRAIRSAVNRGEAAFFAVVGDPS